MDQESRPTEQLEAPIRRRIELRFRAEPVVQKFVVSMLDTTPSKGVSLARKAGMYEVQPAAPAYIKVESSDEDSSRQPIDLHLFLFTLSSFPPAAALGIAAAAALQQQLHWLEQEGCRSSAPQVKLEEPGPPAAQQALANREQQPLSMSTQRAELSSSSSESYCESSEGNDDTFEAESSSASGSDMPLEQRLERRQSLRSNQQQQQASTATIKTRRSDAGSKSDLQGDTAAAGPVARQLEPCIPHATGQGKLKHGYFYSIHRQSWIPLIYVEGKQVIGKACQSEVEAQDKAIALYNKHHPNKPVKPASLDASPNGPSSSRTPGQAAASAEGRSTRPWQKRAYHFLPRLPRDGFPGLSRGYHRLKNGTFRVYARKDGKLHEGSKRSTERDAAEAAWQLHLATFGLPADTAAPPLLPEGHTVGCSAAPTKSTPQKQQRQAGMYKYQPRIPGKNQKAVRGYSSPRPSAFAVGLSANGKQEYGGYHATEEEAAEAAWQLYLNLHGLPRDTPAPPLVPLVPLRPAPPRASVPPKATASSLQVDRGRPRHPYAFAPRVFQEGTAPKRGYSWQPKQQAFWLRIRMQGEDHSGGKFESEEEAAHAAFKMFLDLRGLPASTPEPPLLPDLPPAPSQPQKASEAVVTTPSAAGRRMRYPYKYAKRLFPGSLRPVQGYYHVASAHGARFQPCIALDGVMHRRDACDTEHEAAHESFKLYMELHDLPAHTPAPPLLRAASVPAGPAPSTPAIPAGQAAKKQKYAFAFAPRDFGFRYRPMRAYRAERSRGGIVFRPDICKDGQRRYGEAYKSERDAADAAWILFKRLFKLPADHAAPPLVPSARPVLKRAGPSSPDSSPSPVKKRRLSSSSSSSDGLARSAHRKMGTRWASTTKHAALYRLPMGVLGANDGLKRGYCYTRDAAGTWRWVVDVKLQAEDGGKRRRQVAQNEAEAAELAQQFYCELTGLSRERLRAEVAQRAQTSEEPSAAPSALPMQPQSQPWNHLRPPAPNAAHQRSQRIIMQSVHAKRKRQQESAAGSAAKKHISELQAMHRERWAPITRSLHQPSVPARNMRSPVKPLKVIPPDNRTPAGQQWHHQLHGSPQQTARPDNASDATRPVQPVLEQAVPQPEQYGRSSSTPTRDPRIRQFGAPLAPENMQQELAISQPAAPHQVYGSPPLPDQLADAQPPIAKPAGLVDRLPQQLSTSPQPGSGLAAHADHGGSSATNEPAADGAAVPDRADVQREMEAVCERLLDSAGCAKAFEGVLQAKLRAAMRRAGDAAVESILQDVQSMGDAEARQALEQRRQDLAKIEAYAQGLNGVISSLS